MKITLLRYKPPLVLALCVKVPPNFKTLFVLLLSDLLVICAFLSLFSNVFDINDFESCLKLFFRVVFRSKMTPKSNPNSNPPHLSPQGSDNLVSGPLNVPEIGVL